jgi:uncharacterized protein
LGYYDNASLEQIFTERSPPVVPARVSFITLGTRDMQTMRDFYRKLGWGETAESGEGFAVFRTGGGVLSLFPMNLLVEDAHAGAPLEPGRFKGITLAINVESPELVDTAIEGARAAGARIAKEATDTSWGGRSGYFVDPENNYWEVAWAPGTSFDQRGGLIWP